MNENEESVKSNECRYRSEFRLVSTRKNFFRVGNFSEGKL